MKKEKILNFIILTFPFIDFFTAIATWENLPSIGVLLRSVFLIFAFCFLLKKGFEKKSILVFLGMMTLYSLFDMGFWYLEKERSLYMELSNLIKIFYLPILIVYFKEEDSIIHSSTMIKVLLCYLLLYLLPYPFHLGHNMSELYLNKDLYLSYFYIGNELANVFILLTPIVLVKLIKDKNKSLPIYVLLILAMIYLLGTKALYGSILLILCYFCNQKREKIFSFIKKHLSFVIGFTFILIGVFILWIPQSNFYKNIKTTLEFYQINNVTELLTLQNIDHVIFSDRLTTLSKVEEYYHESSLKNKLFGIGRTQLLKIKDIEIDIFDIYYSIGLLGFLVYLFSMIYALRNTSWNSFYHFLFLLLIFLSCITGHVLLSPMISSYLAILFSLNKEEKIQRDY